MTGNPNNYFSGSGRGSNRPCECCDRPVKIDEDDPAVYGSGRFCSSICAKLRTPEKHWNWMMDHSEEYEAWKKRRIDIEEKKVELGGGTDIVLPIT